MLDAIRLYIIRPGLLLLPERMRSPEAEALLLAIGLQESRFEHRRQIVRNRDGLLVPTGPARGWPQFERIGLQEVMTNRLTRQHFESVCEVLRYPLNFDFVFEGITHNDTLACCAARLLLWADPEPLPGATEMQAGWRYYLRQWRPGKPHFETWPNFWRDAWEFAPDD